jgi:7-cyano-7-deazaguanine synthase in queuosine biosynthesis
MTKRRRDEVQIGVRGALLRLDERELAGCLLALDTGLRAVDEVAAGTDRWRRPDAVWQRLVAADPPLATFPLGGNAERAVKRAVATPGDGGRPLADHAIAALLADLAFDLLRRSRWWQTVDEPHPFPYLYPFAEGLSVLVPVAEELDWRRRLEEEAAGLAGALRPHLDTAAGEARFDDAASRLAAGFGAVFGRRPKRSPGPPPAAADVTSSAGDGGTRVHEPGERPLDLRFGAAGNVSLRLHPPRLHTGGSGEPLALPPLALDLLHVGATVYLADLSLPRRRNLGRRLHLEIGVRRPETWNGLRAELEATIALLGRDDVRLTFVVDPAADGGDTETGDPKPPEAEARKAVLLFSGGLDSLAGAVHLLAGGEGRIDRLHLLSHYADTRLSGAQKALARELGETHGERVVRVPLFVSRSRARERALRRSRSFNPLVQYLRSFLFLSAAAAVAVATDSRKIYVCENGPLALSPTFCEGHVPTRTAHPRLLAQFAVLLGHLFGDRAPTVENPFLYLTKGEAVAVLTEQGAGQLAARSDSCWSAGVTARIHGGVAHDGTCLPCFIRRAALVRASIEEEGDGSTGRRNRVPGYVRDVLTDFADAPADHKLLVADHLRFSATVRELFEAERWDDLLAYAPDLSLDLPGVEPRKLAATWARHAGELFDFVERGRGELRTAFGQV